MKKSKKPVLTDKELIHAVSDRTGLSFNAAVQVIYAYYDIVKEAIENGVEVKMGELGTMSWKTKQPTHGVVYYNPNTGENMPPKEVPGFLIPTFRVRKKWRMELRALTEFWEKENEKED